MSLREKINQQLIAALKEKNKTLVSTLRLIFSAIKDRDIANRSKENKDSIKDPEIINLLKKMKKQRQESLKLYKQGGRLELSKIENDEIKIIDSFLPKQLGKEETKRICKDIMESLGATSIKDIGKIMGELKKNYADSLDFAKAGLILKEILK